MTPTTHRTKEKETKEYKTQQRTTRMNSAQQELHRHAEAMDKDELISNLMTMEAYKQKFKDSQEEQTELREENASLENSNEELENENDELKEENVKLTCWLATAHENADANIHNESAGLIIQENDKLKAENQKLKEDNEELKIYANPDNNRLNRRLLRAEKCLNFDATDKDMAYLLYSDEEDESIGPNRGEDDREQKIKSYAYNYKATLERNEIEIEECKEYNDKLKAEIEALKEFKTEYLDLECEMSHEICNLKKENEVSTARFLDEEQMRAVGLCLISQALGFDYHGDNDEIFKAIKKLKGDFERIGEKLEFEGDTTCEDLLDCLDSLFFLEKKCAEERDNYSQENKQLKASQKQKNRIIKKLKDNVDTLKKNLDEINLEDDYTGSKTFEQAIIDDFGDSSEQAKKYGFGVFKK